MLKFPILLTVLLILLTGCTGLHIIDVVHSSALLIDSLHKEENKNENEESQKLRIIDTENERSPL